MVKSYSAGFRELGYTEVVPLDCAAAVVDVVLVPVALESQSSLLWEAPQLPGLEIAVAEVQDPHLDHYALHPVQYFQHLRIE